MAQQLELPVRSIEKASKNEHSLRHWRKRIEADGHYQGLLKSTAFQRLSGISFLGALDYALPGRRRHTGSRADHSLNVAAIGDYVATARGYSPELRDHVIVAGLLHDIGHPPLSHSAEPSIETQLGYGHHVGGERIIRGQVEIGRDLYKWLDQHVDIRFLLNLLNQEVLPKDGRDLFSSPTNIDTIEGITRASSVFAQRSDDELAAMRVNIAYASFLQEDSGLWVELDRFWCLKHQVYCSLITAPSGLAADQLSQWHFSGSHAPVLSDRDFYTTESVWKKQHPELFLGLKRFKQTGTVPQRLSGAPVRYTARRYRVNTDSQGMARYQCEKFDNVTALPSRGASTTDMEQLGLTH